MTWRLDWSSAGWVQLTEGAAIRAANWSFSVGNGMRVLLGSVAHHRTICRLE
ncbi:hypothetical protein D3C75_1357510 [compost metagenome]